MRSPLQLFEPRVAHFRNWWTSPVSRGDRVFGAFVGAFGGFWVGVLVVVLVATPPISLSTIGLCALGCAVLGVLLGARHPKGATFFLFPFSIFGIGGGS